MTTLVRNIKPSNTVLLFGSGSSVPSGAPTVKQLQEQFSKVFGVEPGDYSLAEQTGIIEIQIKDRARLISELQSQFTRVVPTGAIRNLPLYDWRNIYTTNYDELIEESYKRAHKPLHVYTCNFDFKARTDLNVPQLFKLHGTLGRDESTGDKSRIILTQADYDVTEAYREDLYSRLKGDLVASHLVIIGYSLADPHIQSIVNKVLALRAASGSASRVSIVLYSRDEGRASLFEGRGMDVCFGSIDDFFAGMVQHKVPDSGPLPISGDPLDQIHALRPVTVDVQHAVTLRPNASSMYHGWPASYGDIASGLTFSRNVARAIQQELDAGETPFIMLLGASGVGKTTAARQVMTEIAKSRFAWEHKAEQPFLAEKWYEVARLLQKDKNSGVLFIDDAHQELPAINDLMEDLVHDNLTSLKIILTSTNNQWHLRAKVPAYHKNSKQYSLSIVAGNEVDFLISLVENRPEIRALMDEGFAGFDRREKRRRLAQKCKADMFVCLKNIFSSDKLDHIILREYAALDARSQDVYRYVAALESSGVHVHRQLIMRLLNIRAMDVGAALANLEDIIHETTVSEREGVYSWHGRHKVIMDLVAHYKYYDSRQRYELLTEVVEALSPTYDIELRTIRDLCNLETGLLAIPDKEKQNNLLRKMISTAPAERVPRHRLLRNLIDLGQFDRAEIELQVFQHDFQLDGPATRYKINLATARAIRTKGLMHEDRIVLIEKAREIAAAAVMRYDLHTGILVAYCEVGIEYARLTGRFDVYNLAISRLRNAQERIGDTKIASSIARLQRRMTNLTISLADEEEPFLDAEE